MKLEHEFRVPVPITQAWDVLLDVERIAPCMPGATVESFDGETVNGRVKVKVGPIQVTYNGTARFIEKNEPGRRVTLDASGKEARGSGTAKATIVAVLQDDGEATKVNVTTDLAITGKPAQFGRGVMVEVGNKLLGRFADCLAQEIGMGSSGDAATSDTADERPAAQAAAPAGGGGSGAGLGAAEGSGAGGSGAGVGAAEGSGAGGDGAGVSAAEGSGAGGNGASAATGAEALADAAGGDAVAVAPDGDSGSGDGEGVGAVGAGTGAAGTAAAGTAAASGAEAPNGGQTGSPRIRTLPTATASRSSYRPAENEAIDLLDVGGAAILKRIAPLAIGIVVLVILWRLLHRR
jgi:carbon monoxide dehydrogenase subunit G